MTSAIQSDPRAQRIWTLCVWREARGEGVQGMRAVAWVIRNRAVRQNLDVVQIIRAKNQFTSMNQTKQMPDGSWHYEFPAVVDEEWNQASQIVEAIANGSDTDDPTLGALYYANLATVRAANIKAARPAASGWFFENIVDDPAHHPQLIQIGHHTFYR